MTLTAGAKLGRYEIRSTIGEGGMGEVYRGYDGKRFIFVTAAPGTQSVPFTVVLDWTAEFETITTLHQ